MSCGLGAIILVLMLVKHNVEAPTTEDDRLGAELARLETVENELSARIVAQLRANAAAAAQAEARTETLTQAEAEIARQRDENAASESAAEELERTIESTEVRDNTDVISAERVGEENYIIGLRVEGERIGILVDSSASMTDEVLIDIIRRKNKGPGDKVAGPKWQRTGRVVEWLLARLPGNSSVDVVAFNETATGLGAPGGTAGNDAAGLGRILTDLAAVVPTGPTNLAAGLSAVAAHRPTDLYIITDGLPTAGDSGYQSLNPFSSCSALWGGSDSISGECRRRLFRHTVANAGLDGVRVNVVLLPIEGDPEASHEYWRWTAVTSGILISPAESWP